MSDVRNRLVYAGFWFLVVSSGILNTIANGLKGDTSLVVFWAVITSLWSCQFVHTLGEYVDAKRKARGDHRDRGAGNFGTSAQPTSFTLGGAGSGTGVTIKNATFTGSVTGSLTTSGGGGLALSSTTHSTGQARDFWSRPIEKLPRRKLDDPIRAKKGAYVIFYPREEKAAFAPFTQSQMYTADDRAVCLTRRTIIEDIVVNGVVVDTIRLDNFGCNNEVPNPACSCGFYALPPRMQLPYGHLRGHPFGQKVKPIAWLSEATLEVELYGKIVRETETGDPRTPTVVYRAERQRVLSVGFSRRCALCFEKMGFENEKMDRRSPGGFGVVNGLHPRGPLIYPVYPACQEDVLPREIITLPRLAGALGTEVRWLD